MSTRVAVASTDGKVINEHFGRADRFHVFELNGDQFNYVETRPVSACCHNGEHEDEGFEKVTKVLRDCRAVIVAKIGDGASNYLESKGFLVFEAPYFIEDVLQKIVEDDLLESEK